MNLAYLNSNDFSFFSGAQEQLDQLIKQLQSEHHVESEYGDIKKYINKEGHDTGAGWSLQRAEAVLKLCLLKSIGDFENYWKFYK